MESSVRPPDSSKTNQSAANDKQCVPPRSPRSRLSGFRFAPRGRASQHRPPPIRGSFDDARPLRIVSPTQVAMPIVDRWLDQAPQKLHLLANALAGREPESAELTDVCRDWFRTLDDLAASAAEFNSDGIPLSIEGLDTIAAYLQVTAASDDVDAVSIKQKLAALARLNDLFGRSACGPDDFRNWSTPAKELINDLRRLTTARLVAA
jgi:hypothetical protein